MLGYGVRDWCLGIALKVGYGRLCMVWYGMVWEVIVGIVWNDRSWVGVVWYYYGRYGLVCMVW